MRHMLLPSLATLLLACGTDPAGVDPAGDTGNSDDAGDGSGATGDAGADAGSDASADSDRDDDGQFVDGGRPDVTGDDASGSPDTVEGDGGDASQVEGDTLLDGCRLEQDWWNADRPTWASSGYFGLPVGSALVQSADSANGFHRALALSDGTALVPVAGGELLDVSADGREGLWLRRGEVAQASLVRTVLAGGEPDVSVLPTDGWEWATGVLGASTQVYVRCDIGDGEGFVVEVHRGGAVVSETALDGTCTPWGGVRPEVALSADESLVWVATGATVAVVESAGGPPRVVFTAPDRDGQPGAIPAIDAHPTEDWLAFSSTDSRVRVVDAAGAEIFAPRESDAVLANQWTFAPPRWVSPVRWSPDGRLLAFAMERASLTVIDLESDRTIMTTAPGERAEFGVPEDIDSFAVDAAFTADGTGVVIDYIDGTQFISCDDDRTFDVPTTIDSAIAGPRTVAVGEQATWMAEVRGAGPLLAADFRVDGAVQGIPASSPTVFHRPEAAGEFTLTLRLHDGFAAGSAELVVVAE